MHLGRRRAAGVVRPDQRLPLAVAEVNDLFMAEDDGADGRVVVPAFSRSASRRQTAVAAGDPSIRRARVTWLLSRLIRRIPARSTLAGSTGRTLSRAQMEAALGGPCRSPFPNSRSSIRRMGRPVSLRGPTAGRGRDASVKRIARSWHPTIDRGPIRGGCGNLAAGYRCTLVMRYGFLLVLQSRTWTSRPKPLNMSPRSARADTEQVKCL